MQPVKNWCDSGLTFTNSTTKRDLFEPVSQAVNLLPREFFA